MPTLTTPAIRDQVKTKDQDRFELCGETCLAAALGDDVEVITTWLRNHKGERFVQNGTTSDSLIDYCGAHGVTAKVVYGRAADYVSAAVTRGHYSAVLVWSDHQGRPVPHHDSEKLHAGGIGHWLLAYGVDGSTVKVLQPFGGVLTGYNLDNGQDQHMGIEIDRKVNGSSPAAKSKPGTKPKKPATSPARKGPANPPSTYLIVKGDTLSKIAQKKGVTLAALLKANPQIKDKNKIQAGGRITIPAH